MIFDRLIMKELIGWKDRSSRKPLILRGARQVGKTTIIKEFSKRYKYKILLNLEKAEDKRLFAEGAGVKQIVEALFLSNKIEVSKAADTLIFMDEIQESPEAIQLLRYFYEDYPEIHVIAAGSLLEFAIQEIKSFPVGRVEFLYLSPLNFEEFLLAINSEAAKQLKVVPVAPFAHQVLLDLFNLYTIIGGMPEVVDRYIQSESITSLPRVYESIWSTYKEDVQKYGSSASGRKVIRHIIETAHLYIDQRIKFQHFGNSNYRSREVAEAMRSLNDAKIIQLIYPTTDIAPPVKPNLKKSPRLQYLDTGIVNHTLGIQAEMIRLKDLSKTYKGAIIPHILTQELISLKNEIDTKPNFWVREKTQSSSEVDLVYTYDQKLIPIEIKSGPTGSLKSLHQFVDKSDHPYAVRIYGGAFKIEEAITPSKTKYTLMNLPYYCMTQIDAYLKYFISNY